MQYTIYPTCYHEGLTDSEMERRECSDGVYLSVEQFDELMREGGGGGGEMLVFRLTYGTREAFVHVCGTHGGERYSLLAPAWVCGVLGCFSEEAVTVERAYPGIGRRIKIRPHSTEYAAADDPVGVLTRAFEAYSCIAPGMEIPLMAAGQRLVVSVLETNGDGPICIRGVELEVEIEEDATAAAAATVSAKAEEEAATAAAIAATEAAIASASAAANTFDGDFNAPMIPSATAAAATAASATAALTVGEKRQRIGDREYLVTEDPRFPGRGYRLGGSSS